MEAWVMKDDSLLGSEVTEAIGQHDPLGVISKLHTEKPKWAS